MDTGDKIRTLRKMRKMSQQELATLVGVSRSTIAGYENNHISPSLEVICKLSEIFDAPIDSFIDTLCIEPNVDLSPLEYNIEYLINKFEAELLNKDVLFYEGHELNHKEKDMLLILIDNVKTVFANLIRKG